jgi:hypothetical protein
MLFNPLTWNQIINTGHESHIDPVKEASTGTWYVVPSLNKEWLSDDEVLQQNEGTTNHVPAPTAESQENQLQILQESILPPNQESVVEQSPQMLSPEGAVSQSSEGGIELPPELSEGGVNGTPASVSKENVPSPKQESRSCYWEAELPKKHPRKPNPRYIQLASGKIKLK